MQVSRPSLPSASNPATVRRRFAVLSLGMVAVVALLLVWMLGRGYQSGMLEQGKESSARLLGYLASHEFSSEDFGSPAEDETRRRFEEFTQKYGQAEHIVRMKVHDAEGTILYSDESSLIGRNFLATDSALRRALNGEVVVSPVDVGAPESQYERGRYRRLIEIVIPVQPDSETPPTAVFEFYQDIEPFLGPLRQQRPLLWIAIASTLGVLWAGLYLLMRQATLNWTEAQRSLEASYRERERLAQQLSRSERLLSLGQLSVGIAHEVNNPLVGVLTHLELAEEQAEQGPAPAALREHLRRIREQTTRLRGITERVLSFARTTEAEVKEVDVWACVEKALELVRHTFERDGIQLRIEPRSHNPKVLASADQLEQALLNLLLNSREAMPAGGELAVSVREEGEAATIRIRDSGSGIAPEHLPRVFEPGFSTKAHDDGASGLGLGLFLTRQSLEAMQGTIEATSEPGKGAEFTIRLPRVECGEATPHE